MKRSELAFNILSVPVDFLAIMAAATLAYFLRYEVETIPVIFDLSYFSYLQIIILPVVLLMILLAINGLYNQKVTRGLIREAGHVSTAVSAGLMIVVILFFFNQELFPSRLIILMNWIFIILFVVIARGFLLLVQRNLLVKGRGLHRIFIVEGNPRSEVAQEVENNKKLGYQIVERVSYSEGLLERIESAHRKEKIDELLQADSNLNSNQTLALVELCEELGIAFNYVPGILESRRSNIETDVIGSIPVIRLKGSPLDGWGGVMKRIFDIVFSLIGLLALSPLFVLIAIIIRMDSKGPVFFHHRRGSSFWNFEFYKFRSMHYELSEGTPDGDRIRAELEKQNTRKGPYVKIKNDPRVTRAGRFLRKTKLDELPSLFHVLRGQMSLVGPRIHMTKEVEKFENQHKRLFNTVKPGITGLAQVGQVYNPELAFEEEIKLDLFYIENWSLWLDLSIILKTAVVLLSRRSEGDY